MDYRFINYLAGIKLILTFDKIKNMNTTTLYKTITKKYGQMTAVVEEWNDGISIYQRVRRKMKGTRNFGEVILYGISPIEKGGCYNMTDVIKLIKCDVKMFYID
jgi:hypothetical protein